MAASEGGHIEVIRYLVNAGAKLNAQDNVSVTAFDKQDDRLRHYLQNSISC